MKALFLCAGQGTRLRPYTDERAKPAIPFLGIPLLHHVWYTLEALKISDLIVNLHHRPEDVQKSATLLKAEAKGLKVLFSEEYETLLDSGGGLHQVQSQLEKEKQFVLANGDEVFFPHSEGTFPNLLARHEMNGNLATLLVMDHPEVGAKFGGAYCTPDNKVVKFSKTAVEGLKGWHYVGVMILSPKIFNYMKSTVVPENVLYDSITTAIANKESVEVFPAPMNWYEVGNPTDFLKASEHVATLLETKDDPWIELLKQRIRWAYLEEPLIEKSNPAALSHVKKVLEALKS